MAAAVTNPFKLTWGTFECGGTTERLITGVHRLRRSFDAFEVTLEVLIRGTSDATFAANCAEMESEFSKRRQLLLFQVGASTIQTFNPASGTNTGLNSYARIDKVGTPGADTDRSRLYTVTVGCELPATDASGRRDSSLVVDYDEAQWRTVTISGVWTALTTNGATAQYAAQIAAFCTAALGALLPAGTFELIRQRTEADDQDKVLKFSRVFREVVVAQPGGAPLDSAGIVNPTLLIFRSIDQPGDSGGGKVKRLENVTAHFECWLDKTVSTDLATLYSGTIRPYILQQLAAQVAPTQFAILSERPGRLPFTNQISVDIEFACSVDPTDVIASLITSVIETDDGKVFTGAWTGDPDAHYVDQGHRVRIRHGSRTVTVLGTLGPSDGGGGAGSVWGIDGSLQWTDAPGSNGAAPGGAGLQPSGGNDATTGWVRFRHRSSATPRWIGQPGGDQIAVTDLTEEVWERYVTKPSGGGNNGQGGLQPGPGGSFGGTA